MFSSLGPGCGHSGKDSSVHFFRRGGRGAGVSTIQGALAGGVEGEQVRRKLIVLRVKEQDALRRRFERAKSLISRSPPFSQ